MKLRLPSMKLSRGFDVMSHITKSRHSFKPNGETREVFKIEQKSQTGTIMILRRRDEKTGEVRIISNASPV